MENRLIQGSSSSSWKPHVQSQCTLDHCSSVFLHLLHQFLVNTSNFFQYVLSTWFNKMLRLEFLLSRSGFHNSCRKRFCSRFGRVVTKKCNDMWHMSKTSLVFFRLVKFPLRLAWTLKICTVLKLRRYTTRPGPRPAALAFENDRPSQKPPQAKLLARPGPAFGLRPGLAHH